MKKTLYPLSSVLLETVSVEDTLDEDGPDTSADS